MSRIPNFYHEGGDEPGYDDGDEDEGCVAEVRGVEEGAVEA